MMLDKQDSDRGSPSPIVFNLDPASGVPTYLQLVHQVEQALRLGYLMVGDQLPKVREVVSDLAINPNTVMKAYRELEARGLTSGRPGQGTFVAANLDQIDRVGVTGLRTSLVAWMGEAAESGLDEDGLVALFTSALRDFKGRHGRARSDGATSGPHVRTRGGAA